MNKVCANCGFNVGKKISHVVGKDEKGNPIYSCENSIYEELEGEE